MNRLQAQLIENTNELPNGLLQEIVDFSEFIKQKFQGQTFRKRLAHAQKDIEKGNVKTVTPEELFKELEI